MTWKVQRTTVFAFGLLAAAAAGQVIASPPAALPTGRPDWVPVAPVAAYSLPLVTVVGIGAVRFRIKLGMLLTYNLNAVGMYRSYPSDTKRDLSEQYTLAMLAQPAGAVLASDRKAPVLVLHGHITNAPGTYTLRLTYATSFARRTYRQCTLHLAHTAPHTWQFVGPNGKSLHTFVVRAGIDGIDYVKPCGK